MMDLRICFQTQPDEDGHYRQFYIRVFKRKGQLKMALDVGPDDEAIGQGVVEQVNQAFEMAKGRVKVEELDEQTS